MKKILTIAVMVCFAIPKMAAQEPSFTKEHKVLNIGIGLGSTLYTGSFYSTRIPPISASLEFDVKDEIAKKGSIGVGPYIGIAGSKYENVDWGYKYTNVIIGARGAFHYPFADKLDTYAGLLFAFNIVSAKEFGTPIPQLYSASSSHLTLAGFLGARYYFNDKIGVMAELGYGISYITVGIALKI